MKDEKETLILNKYHTYDALIVVGTALVILGLIVFATVFTGVGSLGRASVIIGVLLFLVGGIMVGNGRVIKKKALGEVDDFYCDYSKKKKPTEKTADTSTDDSID